jgi:hypothetical protein
MNYEDIEDEIKARLEDKIPNDYKVITMEDTEAEMQRPVTQPQVAVCYFQSTFEPSASTSEVSQFENVQFMLMLTARKRRGEKGIYALYEEVRKAALGWTPTGCTQGFQFSMLQFQQNEQGWYIYSLTMETKTIVVQETTEDTAPNSTEITFNENV